MNTCPFTNENTTCSLPIPETGESNGHTPKVAYCHQCSQVAFRCASGHWNRAFARFCTQCGHKLEKPATWDMASANPQRTRILPQVPSVDRMDVNYGFSSWAVSIPNIEQREDLPKLLAIDGLIVIPNPGNNSLEAYTIVKPKETKHIEPQWSIEFNTPLTHGSTPIYHGLHLYYVVQGGIQKTDVFSGETELININGMDAAKIKPISGCAPLKMNIGNSPTMLAGLGQGMLLLDLDTHKADYIDHKFFDEENGLMSPVVCGTYIVFTSKDGQIFTINIGEKSRSLHNRAWNNIWFSAPVALGSIVYFEGLDRKGNRALVGYEPVSDDFSKIVDMDTDDDLDRRLSLYIHPTLTDGEKLFVADRFGRPFYTYQNHQNILGNLNAKGNQQHLLVPHRSVVVNNRIYSAHETGLSVFSPDQNYAVSGRSLAIGGWTGNPLPIAPPIRYGNKLFVLCNDRLVCLDLDY